MTPLIYALTSGDLGKNEQMALETLNGLRDEFTPYIFAPDGAVIKEARKLGIIAQAYSGSTDFTMKFRLLLAASPELGFVAADSKFSYSALLLNFFYRRKMTHLQIVADSGGGEKYFMRRLRLAKYPVTFVTPSKKTREKLIAHGARNDRIRVIENFLPEKFRNAAPRRAPFSSDGVRKVLVVASQHDDRCLDTLFEALLLKPSLDLLEFTIFGAGRKIRDDAQKQFANVNYDGTDQNFPAKLAKSDLYLHLCPEESSNLTILDALAADVPVLAPDAGSETFITNKTNGFCFDAGDALSLAKILSELAGAPGETLNAVVKGGRSLLRIRFSADNSVEKFRRLINENKVGEVELTNSKLIL